MVTEFAEQFGQGCFLQTMVRMNESSRKKGIVAQNATSVAPDKTVLVSDSMAMG